MRHPIPSQCPICGGRIETGKATFTADIHTGVVVVRNVPAYVCVQCGEDWIDNAVAGEIEDIVARTKAQNTQLEMVSMV